MDQKRLRVAVIEDEPLLREAIVRKLTQSNIECAEFDNGKDALEALNNSEILPDAIWLDFYLPDIDGLSFMKEFSANEKLKKIPVIVVSNSANPEHVRSMIDLGAKKFLLKAEYRLDTLIEIVREVTGEKTQNTPQENN